MFFVFQNWHKNMLAGTTEFISGESQVCVVLRIFGHDLTEWSLWLIIETIICIKYALAMFELVIIALFC